MLGLLIPPLALRQPFICANIRRPRLTASRPSRQSAIANCCLSSQTHNLIGRQLDCLVQRVSRLNRIEVLPDKPELAVLGFHEQNIVLPVEATCGFDPAFGLYLCDGISNARQRRRAMQRRSGKPDQFRCSGSGKSSSDTLNRRLPAPRLVERSARSTILPRDPVADPCGR